MELWDKKSAPPLTQTSCIIMSNGKYVQGYILHGTGSRPSDNPSITSGLTFDTAVDDYASLLGGASLSFEPSSYYVSILGHDVSLPSFNVYILDGEYLGASTATGHTRASKMKHTT